MWNSSDCPSDNFALRVSETEFWSKGVNHWSTHRIGWAVSGGCAILTVFITSFSVMSHMLNYRAPAEQRQVIRILYMPPIFGIIAFFSYRYFREYTYYSVSVVLYEAVVISAFMLLLVESLASTTEAGTTQAALMKKDKSKLPFPFCCWRYRPTKTYFIYTVKWSVMQYVIVQPAISVISVVTQLFNLLCVSSFSPKFANLYLTIFALLSNSLAVYGLVVFYELTKRDLKGRRPGAKFWCVNIIVTIPFLQQLLFSALQGAGVLKATKFWTAINVANGLNALVTCIEMVLFSLFMCWAFPISEYDDNRKPRRSAWRALLDSLNFWDFVVEIWGELRFFVDYARDKPGARSHAGHKPRTSGFYRRTRFAEVFGGDGGPSMLVGRIGQGWKHLSGMRGLLPVGRGRSRSQTSESGTTSTPTISGSMTEEGYEGDDRGEVAMRENGENGEVMSGWRAEREHLSSEMTEWEIKRFDSDAMRKV